MAKHHAFQPVCWKQSRNTRWQDARLLLTRWQGAWLWLISQDEININASDLCGKAVARDPYDNAVDYGQLMCTRTEIQMQCRGHQRLVTSLWDLSSSPKLAHRQQMCNVLNMAICDCDASWTAGENQGSNSVMRTELELVKTTGAFKYAMTRTLMATQPSGEQRCQSNVGT